MVNLFIKSTNFGPWLPGVHFRSCFLACEDHNTDHNPSGQHSVGPGGVVQVERLSLLICAFVSAQELVDVITGWGIADLS